MTRAKLFLISAIINSLFLLLFGCLFLMRHDNKAKKSRPSDFLYFNSDNTLIADKKGFVYNIHGCPKPIMISRNDERGMLSIVLGNFDSYIACFYGEDGVVTNIVCGKP